MKIGQETHTTIKNGGADGKEWRDNYTEEDIKRLNEIYTGENSLPVNDWINENQTEIGRTSVSTYGGFYIARYEAGVPEEASFHISKTDNKYVNTKNENFTIKWENENTFNSRGNVRDTAIIKNYKPVSKQGMQAWNYITQPNAKVISENMYKNSADSKGNKVGVKSYLIDSQAWNHICKNIYKMQRGQDTNDSTIWGNYINNTTTNYIGLNCLWAKHITGSPMWTIATEYKTGGITENDLLNKNEDLRLELATGASDDFKKYNIYDMAGNLWEFTSSHNIEGDDMFVVIRGGGYNSRGNIKPVTQACDGYHPATNIAITVGFRAVLYIN